MLTYIIPYNTYIIVNHDKYILYIEEIIPASISLYLTEAPSMWYNGNR